MTRVQTPLRPDLALIAAHVATGARVLDVGCGDGTLMAALQSERACDARGMELDSHNVAACVGRGLSVIQGDADVDLAYYPDAAFDYAILSQTLQTTKRPDRVLTELLRIGQRAFVSFPNFGHWRVRLALLLGGRMPVTKRLPYQWFDTPNIRVGTHADLGVLASRNRLLVQDSFGLQDGKVVRLLPNLLAGTSVYTLSR